MNTRQLRLAVLGALLVLALPTAALAIAPVNGGLAPGTTIPANNSSWDQTDPQVSGALVAYTDLSNNPVPGFPGVRYFDLATQADAAIPGSTP